MQVNPGRTHLVLWIAWRAARLATAGMDGWQATPCTRSRRSACHHPARSRAGHSPPGRGRGPRGDCASPTGLGRTRPRSAPDPPHRATPRALRRARRPARAPQFPRPGPGRGRAPFDCRSSRRTRRTVALAPHHGHRAADAEPHALGRRPLRRLRPAMLEPRSYGAQLAAVRPTQDAVDSSHGIAPINALCVNDDSAVNATRWWSRRPPACVPRPRE